MPMVQVGRRTWRAWGEARPPHAVPVFFHRSAGPEGNTNRHKQGKARGSAGPACGRALAAAGRETRASSVGGGSRRLTLARVQVHHVPRARQPAEGGPQLPGSGERGNMGGGRGDGGWDEALREDPLTTLPPPRKGVARKRTQRGARLGRKVWDELDVVLHNDRHAAGLVHGPLQQPDVRQEVAHVAWKLPEKKKAKGSPPGKKASRRGRCGTRVEADAGESVQKESVVDPSRLAPVVCRPAPARPGPAFTGRTDGPAGAPEGSRGP